MTNETWREACEKLRNEGMVFECCYKNKGEKFRFDFINDRPLYFEIAQQPIPNRPDWREWCKRLQDAGVRFDFYYGDWEFNKFCDFHKRHHRDVFRIAQQPIPPNIGDLIMEETKPDPREEIPHREQQIQWHEDMLHHLRTGEPMKKWQCKPDGDNRWFDYTGLPTWIRDCEYRRKPKMKKVTYWHCYVPNFINCPVMTSHISAERLLELMPTGYQHTPITESTVEIEVEE